MRQSFWNKRIPTLFALFFLTVSILALSFAAGNPQLFELKAREPIRYEDIRISNQTSTSLSFSFRTSKPQSVQLRFGTTLEKAETIFDDRDQINQERGLYRTHHFTMQNLSPSSQYLFAMLSEGETFNNGGNGFLAKTPGIAIVKNESLSAIEPVKGTVLTTSGTGAKNALVYVHIDGASLLSDVVKSEGQFLIPLTQLYTSDLTGLFTFIGNEVLKIEIFGDDGSSSIISVPLGRQGALPTITLGNNLDVTLGESSPSPTGGVVEKQESSGFQDNSSLTSSTEVSESVILTPSEGDFLIDQKPLIRGKGSPLQKIEITVESDPQTAQLTVDANGQWVYQPDKPLEPGKHTVSVRFFDGATVSKIISQQFEVLASGTQVTESATPSPTSVLEVTPTLSVTPLPTGQEIPNTGTAFPAIILVSLGGVLAILGFFARRFLL